MRKISFFTFSLLFISTLFSLNTFAQDAPLRTLEGHGEAVASVALSPDGNLLASGSRDNTIRLWDVYTGEHLRTLEGHGDDVNSVTFSPNGNLLASGSRDSTIRLWDVHTGERLSRLVGKWSVNSVAFSSDGNQVASGNLGGQVLIQKLHGRPIGARSFLPPIYSIAFSPDGHMFASGTDDNTIRLWDVHIGDLRNPRTLEGHMAPIYSVAFSPNRNTLASGSDDKTIRLWDVHTWKHMHTLEGHMAPVNSVAFSPDGNTLASGSDDKTIRLWDVRTWKYMHTLEGHWADVTGVAFSPDGQHVRTSDWHGNIAASVAFSPNGDTLASASVDRTIGLWDVHTGELLRTSEWHGGEVTDVAFSPDGNTLAIGSRHKIFDMVFGSRHRTIGLWEVRTGERLRISLLPWTSTIWSVAFSPDGNALASGSADDTIRLWDVHTGEHLRTLKGHGEDVASVAFSPDGNILASGSADETIRLWEVHTGKHLRTLEGHTGPIYSVAFSSDGNALASGSDDNTIRLWGVHTGEHLRTLKGHGEYVTSVVFSPDGNALASGSRDDTIRLWEVRTGKHLRTLEGHTGPIYRVAFSPDGKTLASGSVDDTIRLWETLLPNFANAHAKVLVSPSPVESPAIGEQLTLSLSIAGGGDVGGYQATIQFDPTALRYVDSAIGDFLPPGAFFVPPVVSENQITIAATSLGGSSSGDGTLATLTLEVIDVKKSGIFVSGLTFTDMSGQTLIYDVAHHGEVVIPTAVPSPAIVRIRPSAALSPPAGAQLVFNVDIAGGQGIVDYELRLDFDDTALEHLSSGKGDYFADGVGNGDGTLFTAVFKVIAVKTSTVSVSGQLTGLDGFKLLPTFESATINAPIVGDVNRDGTVNILDLVRVASNFGQQVPKEGDATDVNEDGVVDIIDLVKVAGAIGNAAAPVAPSARIEGLAMLSANDVRHALAEARSLNLADPVALRGIRYLEGLLAALIPKATVLLANYPNPFNPETWIPYRLATDAHVSLRIYDPSGRAISTIDLGHQRAAAYESRTEAIYWDGRNDLGEQVASGLYFYTLTAGDYKGTRKMLVGK